MFETTFVTFQLLISLLLLTWIFRQSIGSSIFENRYKAQFKVFITGRFINAGFSFDPHVVWGFFLTVTAISIAFGLSVSPVMAIIAPLFVWVFVYFSLESKAKQLKGESKKINDQVCFFLARSLRAGQTLDDAIIIAKHEFKSSEIVVELYRYLKAGSTLSSAVERIGKMKKLNYSSADMALCATIGLAHQIGGNSARAFERIGDTFHYSYDLSKEIRASLSQVKLSVIVISTLPFVMFTFSLLLGSDSSLFLFSEPLGWMFLSLGVALEGLGIFWMKQLVDNGVKIWNF